MITDILLQPVQGDFDLSAIRAFLDNLRDTTLDPVERVNYMLASDAGTLQRALDERRADPKHFPMSVILVSVVPHQISISYRTQEVEPARQLVDWLRGRYKLRILDEAFRDITAKAEDLDYLFGARGGE